MALTQRKTETCEINGKTFQTHHWYMNCAKELTGMERHRAYYGQFVTPGVKAMVSGSFTKRQWEQLAKGLASGDEHLNNEATGIPLAKWDAMDCRYLVGRLVTECTYEDAPKGTMYWSPSQNTCILKEAARQMLEDGSYPK